jgi:hypothetical protein
VAIGSRSSDDGGEDTQGREADEKEATKRQEIAKITYGNTIGVLLSNALGLSLALLERMLVLKFAAHAGGGIDKLGCDSEAGSRRSGEL